MSVSELDRWDYNKREVLHNESPNIADSEWKPADPLVVYSNIRNLIKENEKLRGKIREENTELLATLEKSLLLVDTSSSWSACRDFVQQAHAAIAKAKGEQV